jgi:hypothetical protein
MAKTKAQLRTENSNNFPNNNSQFITPEKLRGFNNDIIDSVALEANTQLSGTGSFSNLSGSGYVSASEFIGDGSKLTGVVATVDTGSLLVTASFDNGTRDMTFTKGDSSTFTTNIPGGDTGSLIETASVVDATITFTKADSSTFNIEVDNVTSSLETQDVFVNVKNTSGSPISKGLAVHATGVTGENVNIKLADSTISSDMPAIGLLNQTLADQAVGQAIISGRIKNIDTSGLVAGQSVYVNGSGTLTSTKPTGSDLIQNIGICGKVNATEGEIIVQGAGRSNDVPNIPQGQIWVGNVNGVATPTSTGSFAKIDENNTFTGTQTFNNITVNGTGSFAYIQSVTGSAKIIGDAFLILNNDTPTERYAGIKVYDSGSSNNTSSFQYDGSTDDWFFEKDVLGTAEYGIALFGPEYTTKGTPTYNTNNTIPKGTGGHHLNDSNISDNGTTITLNSNTDVQGNITVTGTVDGVDIQTLNSEVTTVSSSVHDINSNTGSYARTDTSNTFTAGPQISSGSDGYFQNKTSMPSPSFTQKLTNDLNGQSIGIYLTAGQSPTGVAGYVGDYDIYQKSFLNYPNIYGRWYSNVMDHKEAYVSDFSYGSEEIFNGGGWRANVACSGSLTRYGSIFVQDNYNNHSTVDLQAQGINIGTNTAASTRVRDGINIGSVYSFNIITGDTTFNSSVFPKGIISSSNYISASAFIGDGSQLSGVQGGIFTETGSYYSTTNNLEVTGSFDVKGGIGGSSIPLTITSNTASLDLTQGNNFTLTLVSSADTHLDVTTFGKGAQSVNIKVKQPETGNTGSISFSGEFKFGQGYTYVPTPIGNATDIISFQKFDESILYGTYINNFN